jgi:CubicO group peptidase (beta-lactamase class C family)
MTTDRSADRAARSAHLEAGVAPEPTLESAGRRRVPLADRMAVRGVPGVSVAVVDDWALDWARGYGYREAGKPERVTQATLFQAASLSKPVAALAALRLVQEGVLDLDEDVNRYLIAWQVPANGAWQPRVTLRHLLSHSGGLTVHGFPGYTRQAPRPDLPAILDGRPPANTAPIRVNALPGTQSRYSGGGYTVLQQLLGDVTGEPFPTLMRRLVLAPLGMTHSTYEQPLPRPRWKDAATGHAVGGAPVAGKWHTHPEQAAAGLWTTPSDLARFVGEVMNAYLDRPHALLDPPAATEMLTRQAGDFGLGLILGGEGDSRYFWHAGDNVGFKCLLIGYPQAGKGAVVMTNGDEGIDIIIEIIRALGEDDGWPAAEDSGWLPLPRAPRLPIVVDPTLYPAYTGTYRLSDRARVVVATEGDGLVLEAAGQPALALVPHAEGAFFARELNTAVRFVRNDTGSVVALELQQNGETLRAEKQP